MSHLAVTAQDVVQTADVENLTFVGAGGGVNAPEDMVMFMNRSRHNMWSLKLSMSVEFAAVHPPAAPARRGA